MPYKIIQEEYIPGKTTGNPPPKTFGVAGGYSSEILKTAGTLKKIPTTEGGMDENGLPDGGVVYVAGEMGDLTRYTGGKTTGTTARKVGTLGDEGVGTGKKTGTKQAKGDSFIGKPTTGLDPKVVIDDWTGPWIDDGPADDGYREWENEVIKKTTPLPKKEVKDLNPKQFLPPGIPVPPIVKDTDNKFWVFNECNQRWWTPDYAISSVVQSGMSPTLGSGQPGRPAIMWSSWDNINQEYIRRNISKWCGPEDPYVPPMDDCAKYGINCPEELPSGKVFTRIEVDDILPMRTEHVTYGIWSGDSPGNLLTFHTCSQAAATESFYRRVFNKACNSCESEVQFDIAYGHDGGSGSADLGGFDYLTPTNAVYSQYKQLCLGDDETRFTIGGREVAHIYVINVKKERMKERLDEGNIEINLAHLSGSEFEAGGGPRNAHTGSNVKVKGTGQILRLIDDSNLNLSETLSATALSGSYNSYDGGPGAELVHKSTVAGRVYNIVSGSLEGGVYQQTNPHVFGLLFPQLGVIVLDADKLDATASFLTCTGSDRFGDNPHKLYTAMSGAALYTDDSGDYLGFQARRKVTEYSEYYFIRIKNGDYNFTNNPTYVSGSNGLIVTDFIDNHKVYYTSVGLYNERKELVAVGKVSRALQKNYTTEGLLRVRIKY